MKTDDLISMLATGVAPVDPHFAAKRLRLALAGGGTLAVLLMVTFMGVNPNLRSAAVLPLFWLKLVFPATLFLLGVLLTARLAIPGRPWRSIARIVPLPVVTMFLLATAVLLNTAPPERLPMVLGDTWSVCALRIGLVSMPVFVAAFWAVRGLAPTQLRLAGACAGMLAGGLGSVVYALHCPEMAVPFVTVWYTSGVVLTAGLGALLGPKLLRW